MICSTIQSIDKALVARRFAHARNTYGREALVQQQVAEKMLRLLTKHACPSAAAHNGNGNTRSVSGNASPFRHIESSDAEPGATPVCCCTHCNRKLCCSTTCVPK